MIISCIILLVFTTVDILAAILDSELGAGEALATLLVGIPACRSVSVKNSQELTRKLGNFDKFKSNEALFYLLSNI